MILTQTKLAQLLAVAASLLALAPAELEAQPAGNGQMGTTSHASARISVSVLPRFAPQQHEFAERRDTAGGQRGPAQRFCISSNAQAGSFSVTASDALPGRDSAGGAPSHGVAYVMELQASQAGSSGALDAGPVLDGPLAAAALCGARPTAATIAIRPASASERMGPDLQPGAVLLLIAPN
jgi:hypothetical protein